MRPVGVRLAAGPPIYFVSSFGWSRDGTTILVDSPLSLRVLRLADLSIVNQIDAKGLTADQDFRFGRAAAFTPDQSQVLFTGVGTSPGALLYVIGLKSRTLSKAIDWPFAPGGKAHLDDYGSSFVWHGNDLYFSAWIQRFDEYRYTSSGNPFVSTKPSTCVAAGIGKSGAAISIISRDFPLRFDTDTIDGASDIFGCRYDAGLDAFVVAKASPEAIPTAVPEVVPSHRYYETVAAKDGRLLGGFGRSPSGTPISDDGQYSFDAARSVAAVLGTSTTNQHWLVLWNIKTGAEISRLSLPVECRDPKFSPDGAHLTLLQGDVAMPIFKLDGVTETPREP